MRARAPDVVGHVVRDGLTLGYERYGDPATSDRPTILLLPTWTIIHARFWKLQVPYLARHFPVVVYDGPGNGASDRTTDPTRFTGRAYAQDAAAVLDECGVDRAVVVGLSLGGRYAIELAALRPELVAGLVLIGPALPLAPVHPERAAIGERFLDPAPENPDGWERYNLGVLARPLRRLHPVVLRAGTPRTALHQGAGGRRRVGRRDRRQRPRSRARRIPPANARSANCSPACAAPPSWSTATTIASSPTPSGSRPPGSPAARS